MLLVQIQRLNSAHHRAHSLDSLGDMQEVHHSSFLLETLHGKHIWWNVYTS